MWTTSINSCFEDVPPDDATTSLPSESSDRHNCLSLSLMQSHPPPATCGTESMLKRCGTTVSLAFFLFIGSNDVPWRMLMSVA